LPLEIVQPSVIDQLVSNLPQEKEQPSVIDQLVSNLPQEKEQPSSVNPFVFRLISVVIRLLFFSGSGSVF
jgi:hypothetical protein